MLPELRGSGRRRPPLGGEYSSADVLSRTDELAALPARKVRRRRRCCDGEAEGGRAWRVMKVMTVLGTRPEIIRLSRVIPRLDAACDHVLVHTGQNFDAPQRDVLRASSACGRRTSTSGVRGDGVRRPGRPDPRPDRAAVPRRAARRLLILGDTNSGLAAFVAKRLGIRVVPHGGRATAATTTACPRRSTAASSTTAARCCCRTRTGARRTWSREGIERQRIFVTGNPIKEVLDHYAPQIDAAEPFDAPRRRARRVLPRDGPPRGERRRSEPPRARSSRR